MRFSLPAPRFSLFGAALVAVALVGAALSSCIATGGTLCDGACSCPSEATFTLQAPDGGTAPPGASVSEYMARRCGTLDCHGSSERPMRLYGSLGLRNPTGTDVSGGNPTTAAERALNYAAVCSIEPEATQAAVDDDGQSADQLLVVEKALGVEAHKGGQIVTQGSPGYNCIAGWLKADPPATVAGACQMAIDGL
jgi:hypothetical protein